MASSPYPDGERGSPNVLSAEFGRASANVDQDGDTSRGEEDSGENRSHAAGTQLPRAPQAWSGPPRASQGLAPGSADTAPIEPPCPVQPAEGPAPERRGVRDPGGSTSLNLQRSHVPESSVSLGLHTFIKRLFVTEGRGMTRPRAASSATPGRGPQLGLDLAEEVPLCSDKGRSPGDRQQGLGVLKGQCAEARDLCLSSWGRQVSRARPGGRREETGYFGNVNVIWRHAADRSSWVRALTRGPLPLCTTARPDSGPEALQKHRPLLTPGLQRDGGGCVPGACAELPLLSLRAALLSGTPCSTHQSRGSLCPSPWWTQGWQVDDCPDHFMSSV